MRKEGVGALSAKEDPAEARRALEADILEIEQELEAVIDRR